MQTNNKTARLILASSSVYRRELLGRLRLDFESMAPDLDEAPLTGESPVQTALRLAQEKARTIARNQPETIIIGSDQVATLDNLQIGKPGSHAAALKQLQLMRGREVAFHTALCVLDNRLNAPTPLQIQDICTIVKFRDLSDQELDAYLHLEQPYDCAGSAKNEGLGITILESIKSDDPTALTGLPLIALTGMLRNTGIRFFGI
ncbi:Maf family nucleotide pyrophosphatase [Undibacterium sp. TS12]|uniref:Maf family nucleotide pyrophosphatase n=1 Tax=Undibacterium sp. TS12 TaxID=2908202 RepID=UPI001F4CE9C7|nr:Maf family nucleotide pyrophosphatase [Undibacterium sp. TS12]MCH8618463.1 Maf family nucleotide pyrophosphatase [Undibacterium sp. TS12]